MAQDGYQVKGGRGRKGKNSTTGPKSMDDVKTFLFSQEGKTYMQALMSIGVKNDPSNGKGKDTNSSKGKGKGKGKGAKGDQGKNSNSPTHPSHTASDSKSKGKGKNRTRSSVSGGGDRSSQSFYAGSSGLRKPTITVIGTQGQQALMIDAAGNPAPIQFICHNPECHLCHYKQRKACMACDTPRDVGLEPTVYNPQVHNSYIAQRRITTMMVPKAPGAQSGAKVLAGQSGAKVQACASTPNAQQSEASNSAGQSGAKVPASSDKPNLFPQDWGQIDTASEDSDMDPEEDPVDVAHAATIQEEKELMKSWHPSCLTKANVRLCLHEGSQEVLLYKHLFDIQDLAESELTREIELYRRPLRALQGP